MDIGLDGSEYTGRFNFLLSCDGSKMMKGLGFTEGLLFVDVVEHSFLVTRN